MNFENKKYKIFIKVEFWVAAAVMALALIALFAAASDDASAQGLSFGQAIEQLWLHYLTELAQFLSIYLSYLLLNFKVVPALINSERIAFNVGLIVFCFFVIGIAFNSLDVAFAPLLAFAIYTAIKYTAIYTWEHADALRNRFKFLAPGVMLALPLWVFSIIFLTINEADWDAIVSWTVIVLAGIVMYSYSFLKLIPRVQVRKRPLLSFLISFMIIVLVSEIAIGFISALFSIDEDMPMAIVIINTFFQVLFIAPLSWIVYKRSSKADERIISLERELGQSNANFDFLRSQINPHFLFNALNTLYGTAIQENAERTAEGIQKLGDMMRFMLQENMQEKISLAREVDYLTNYINLQRLRTDPIPTITITTDIEQSMHLLQIAPMLLIPFVENAFKHGISFREPSFIKISLYTQHNVLYFDVSNSVHSKAPNDPEKDNSGIGLTNVKQRLALLYKKKHELTIRESPREFFVHLSIQLS
ncbi:MAG TPA: histidine kinase [Chryseosolibacter sp.]